MDRTRSTTCLTPIMTNVPAPTAQSALVSKLLDQNTTQHTSEPSDDSRYSTLSSPYGDSRASTPDSAAPLQMNFRNADVDRNWSEKPENVTAAHAASGVGEDTVHLVGAAGRQPEEVYTRTLSWWRAGIRRAILRNVEAESKVLANMQVSKLLFLLRMCCAQWSSLCSPRGCYQEASIVRRVGEAAWPISASGKRSIVLVIFLSFNTCQIGKLCLAIEACVY